MKKPIKIAIYSAILIFTIILALVLFLDYQKAINTKVTKDSKIYVSGDGHINKGEYLDPNWQEGRYTILLSERASYLNSTVSLESMGKAVVEDIIRDAEKDGMCLVVVSGYRDKEEQEEMYNLAEDKEIIAKAGQSEHQTGLAVDFAGCPMKNGKRDDSIERLELEKPFKELPEYKWLVDNAYKYNLEQSYREDNAYRTGYPEEPWHWKLIVTTTEDFIKL